LMAIKVVHTKVSTIPDGDDSSLIRPSDWNADHTLEGLGTMAEQNANNVNITGGSITGVTIPAADVSGLGTMATQNANNVSITGGSISGATVSGYIPTTQKAAANGVATLDGSTKIPIAQIPDAVIGALNYQGTWNASTNSPTLTSSTGTKGYYYVVSVAGSINLDGITDWLVGDWAVFNGSVWQKIDNTDAVTSVNGLTGAVVLTTTNIAEGTNEYYTDARARAALSAGSGISYNSTTGVISSTVVPGTGDVVGPSSATDNAVARFNTTTGKLIQNSVVVITDAGDMSGAGSLTFDGTNPTSPTPGTIWFDASTNTWNAQQNAITQQIGEETLVYGKATNTISGETLLQAVVKTGAVGASGVITFGVAGAGITDAGVFIGMATEDIATNGFGRVTAFGVVHGINTTGSTYGETWVDGQDIWYNPTTGGLTKTKPSAPNIKVQLGTVINAGPGGSGSFQVLIGTGSELGGTDSNVQLTSPTAAQLLTYSTTDSYWKNTSLAAGTGISVGNAASGVVTVTNSAPDQVVSLTAGTGISTSGTYPSFTITNTAPDQTVALTAGTGISVTGTYPNFTVTNTSPSSGGTVTSVTGTAPIASSGGNTPAISINQATTSTDGYLSSTDWNTFNNKATYPSQTGNSGKFLTTNGSATSWATLPTVLPVLNHSGSTVSVAVGNGLLPVLNRSGSTINVAVQ
jgi:hypothetical protein